MNKNAMPEKVYVAFDVAGVPEAVDIDFKMFDDGQKVGVYVLTESGKVAKSASIVND